MPKLNSDIANKVEQAEDGFKPVPEGVYVLQLMEDVDVRDGKKAPYWRWTFEIPEGEEFAGRRFWTNTSLSEAAYFKLKETFSAFGVPTDTDTEELVGKRVKAVILQRTIQGGNRSGEIGNEIDKLMPLDSDVQVGPSATAAPAADSGAKSTDKDDEPLF